MSHNTLYIYLLMYAYGFSMMIWAAFIDKNPTKKSLRAAKWGLAALGVTLIYFFSVLWLYGITD